MLGMLRCMLSVVSCVFGVFVLRVRRFQFFMLRVVSYMVGFLSYMSWF